MKKLMPLLILLLSFICIAKAQDPRIKNLGSQIHSATVQASMFYEHNNSNHLYTVVRGRPAHLVGFDLNTNQLIANFALEDTDGSWAMTAASDGTIYVASAQGYLFTYKPGKKNVTNLGRFENEKLIWDLVPGQNGEIYGGTYPGCRVFKYHPDQGFSDISSGETIGGEQYAQFLALDQSTENIYVATYVGADVVQINTKTKEKKRLFDEEYRKFGSIYNIKLIHESGKTKLLVWLNHKQKGRQTLKFNTETLEIEETLKTVEVRPLLSHNEDYYYPIDDKVYRTSRLDSISTKSPKLLQPLQGKVKASRWTKDKKLQYFTTAGTIATINPLNNQISEKKLEVPRQPIDIQSVHIGPDKKVWMGGYLAGGHAVYDPATNSTKEYTGLHQTEGMVNLGDTIYFGIYSGAKIYKHNTKAAWDIKSGNPRILFEIKNQSRPFANIAIEKSNKAYFATVPNYGALGGALTVYDANSNSHSTFDIIPNESPVTLLLYNGKIWGGTSISGGLGIKPVSEDCTLFCFDPITNEVIAKKKILKGHMAITALLQGPDNNIWGLSDGFLFIYNPKTDEIIHKQKVYDFNRNRTHIWIDGKLVLHPNGKIYGTGGNMFFEIDPKTKTFNKITDGVGLLAMDHEANIYFRKEASLLQFKP